MLTRNILRGCTVLAAVSIFAVTLSCRAQDEEKHGRKYKAPAASCRITVEVVKGYNGKPISNAAVIFHPVGADGKDDGNLEIKTGPDGKAMIDVIPVGSHVRLQVFAPGFATFGEQYEITTESKDIHVAMQNPQAQMSAYEDNAGKSSQRQPGVQEPIRPNPATGPTQPVAVAPPVQKQPLATPVTPPVTPQMPNQ